MDRSNLLIGSGVLIGIATFAYWFVNREDGASGAERAAQRAEDAYARRDDKYTDNVVTPAYPISREQEDDWGYMRRGVAERGY